MIFQSSVLTLFLPLFCQGCYHFPDDTFMGLVKMNLECLPGTKMKHDCIFNILAPIDTEHLMCELRGNESEYTLNGHEWFTFRSDPEVFSLSRFIPDPTIKIIEVFMIVFKIGYKIDS